MKSNDEARNNYILNFFALTFLPGGFLRRFNICESVEDSFFGSVKKKMKPLRIIKEKFPQAFIDCKYHMSVIHIQSGSGNHVSTCPGSFGTAGRAESAFACVTDYMMPVAVRTFIDFKAHIKGTAGNHAGDFINNVMGNGIRNLPARFNKGIPKLVKDNLKSRFLWIVPFHKGLSRSFDNWLCKIIGYHNCGFLIYSIGDRKKRCLKVSVFFTLRHFVLGLITAQAAADEH